MLHVLNTVDGDTRLANVPAHALVVAVIAAVGGEIEGNGQTLLPAGQCLPVKGVAFLSGGKAGVLANGPRPLRVHAGIGAAHEGRFARCTVQMV